VEKYLSQFARALSVNVRIVVDVYAEKNPGSMDFIAEHTAKEAPARIARQLTFLMEVQKDDAAISKILLMIDMVDEGLNSASIPLKNF
jgi:hypothetical protein